MAGEDWARYWRADGVPVEAMHAHFTSHVYHRHSHESYSFGVTETGAQAFTCRHGRHVSASGMVMAFNPDDPHDGHAAVDGGFTYRMVHIWPEFLASLTGTPLPLFRSPHWRWLRHLPKPSATPTRVTSNRSIPIRCGKAPPSPIMAMSMKG